MIDHEANGRIILDEVEETLKQLLLDVANFIEQNPLPTEQETSQVLLPPELKKAPLELRFAGGWVRDKLLGTKSHDIDVAINKMTGEQFGERLREYLDVPGTADKYGLGSARKKAGSLTKIEKNPAASKNLETVTTKILGIDLDLVNLRKETYTEDSRNPQVEFGTPEEDALRRDATINALFYNITTNKLEDYTGSGLSDMKNKIIRTPLEPYTTFKDDPLRVLRLIRFASRLGYVVDAKTLSYMGNGDIRKFFLAKITKERVWIEFEKMLRGPDPRYALSLIDDLDLYRTVFMDPARPDLYKAETSNWSAVYQTWDAILKSGDRKRQALTSLLITDNEEAFMSWFLASMIPWADAPEPEPSKTGKNPPPLATQMALAAFKAPNSVTNVLSPSVINVNEIRAIKDRQEKARDVLGMAIRKWGSSWRSQVIFALLYEIYSSPSRKDAIISEYANVMSTIASLNLLDVVNFKPLIDGTALAKAISAKPGPWMKPALDIVMAWQLRNPSITDPAEAIEEVRTSDVVSTTPASVKSGQPTTNGQAAKRQKKGELTSALASHFLRETLKPLFSTKAPNPEITPAGRMRITKQAGDLNSYDFSEVKPWKSASSPWALPLLLWCCRSVDAKTLEKEWGVIIPPLLVVLDDGDTHVRAQGCNMLVALLSTCPPELLKRTGLAPLFEESLYNSVAFLPSLTPEAESVILLDAAIPALLALVNVSCPPSDGEEHDAARQKTLDIILRKGILQPYSNAGEHVRIAEVLLKHLPPILAALGIDSVKHLHALVPLLSTILSDPLGLGYPPLLLQAAKGMQAVIANSWPRIPGWKGEIINGACVCWIRLVEEGHEMDAEMLGGLRKQLKTIMEMLQAVMEAHSEDVTWREDVHKLVEVDTRLQDLLVVGDHES